MTEALLSGNGQRLVQSKSRSVALLGYRSQLTNPSMRCGPQPMCKCSGSSFDNFGLTAIPLGGSEDNTRAGIFGILLHPFEIVSKRLHLVINLVTHDAGMRPAFHPGPFDLAVEIHIAAILLGRQIKVRLLQLGKDFPLEQYATEAGVIHPERLG